MYKGKPVVQYRQHWWRHRVFPWGWYSLAHDRFDTEPIFADGCCRPGDGGGGIWKRDKTLYVEGFDLGADNGGGVIEITDDGKWIRPNVEVTGGAKE